LARNDKAGKTGGMCCHGSGYGKLFIGIFILAIGFSWLGNDMGWWKMNLPWLPLALTIVGIALIFGWSKREYE